jgi:hypothetical protein
VLRVASVACVASLPALLRPREPRAQRSLSGAEELELWALVAVVLATDTYDARAEALRVAQTDPFAALEALRLLAIDAIQARMCADGREAVA